MTNKELIDLYKSLNAINLSGSIKFSYAIAKNINLLKAEIENLEKLIIPTEGVINFNNERIELAKKLSKKDKDGNPIVIGNNFDVEDLKKFEKELKPIQEKYKKEIDEYEKKKQEYNNFLKEENGISLLKIDINDVPKEITNQQLNSILSIVEGEIK